MTRTLHILDQRDAPAGLGQTLGLIADAQAREPAQHHTLLLGGEPIRTAARRVGLTHTTLQPSPRGLTHAALALRREPRDLLASADRVECWSIQAADYAARVGCRTFQPRFGQVGDTGFARQTIAEDRLGECDREAVRNRWGLSPNDQVIALLCDRPAAQSALPASLTIVLAQETRRAQNADDARQAKRLAPTPAPTLRLLIPPDLAKLVDAERVYTEAGYPDLLLQDPDLAYPWSVLPACDGALIINPQLAGLSAIWAKAANLPTIGGQDTPLPPKHLARQLVKALTQSPCKLKPWALFRATGPTNLHIRTP
ncbi:MAG: hypothetical protein AAGC44_14650 [Planctomycetota bacterium]